MKVKLDKSFITVIILRYIYKQVLDKISLCLVLGSKEQDNSWWLLKLSPSCVLEYMSKTQLLRKAFLLNCLACQAARECNRKLYLVVVVRHRSLHDGNGMNSTYLNLNTTIMIIKKYHISKYSNKQSPN